MANEKRLIDANEAKSKAILLECPDGDGIPYVVAAVPVSTLDNFPTVDAVILPCKLGTTLYRICEEHLGRKPFIRVVTFNRTNFTRIVLDNEVGRTVFLTREEAEAQLAKMKEGADND